ncbi:MAG TPA: peptide-methionine (S)-S-oxide reductase MsrA [Gammaproteobacteria bacterium]|nr:peptide-methionine (S)-S-oxide reductase MsrA [Gammaproteobacteria bacterium]
MSRRLLPSAAGTLAVTLLLAFAAACAPAVGNNPHAPRAAPAPTLDAALAAQPGTAKAVLAGGCFWGLQWVFEHVPGVTNVTSGYSGGTAATAHYERVSMGGTGHAETVQIDYDPSKATYGQLLQVYFTAATNPTELNRQGPDTGTQYRGVIFYTNAEQQKIARTYIAQLTAAHVYTAPIVTQVAPFKAFYPAEDYHQDYARRHPEAPYIAINDAPKVATLQRLLPGLYRAQPVIWHDGDPSVIMVDLH